MRRRSSKGKEDRVDALVEEGDLPPRKMNGHCCHVLAPHAL